MKAVVETDETSTTADVFESEIMTVGVVAYARPKVMVHVVALVPVVKFPVSSFALAPMTGEPVPQEDMAGVAGVEEAVRWPY